MINILLMTLAAIAGAIAAFLIAGGSELALAIAIGVMLFIFCRASLRGNENIATRWQSLCSTCSSAGHSSAGYSHWFGPARTIATFDLAARRRLSFGSQSRMAGRS